MRSVILALALAIAASPAEARGHRGDTYVNSDGVTVHRPVQATQPPPGATAQCRDGSYSFSLHHRGTCSYHGGVMRWL
ncbi:DUF3761 domain-containing protein [Caulobacter sp. KR2-114]|uniref:DUF3761 domain-containing protein n=1 Tax=Caulobacter sp. KR2-114 TaxID=3400912 RepID=UPI003C122EB5